MFYHKTSGVPQYGSIAYAICLYVSQRLEERQRGEVAAQLRASGGKDAQKVFELYVREQYKREEKAKEAEKLRALHDLVLTAKPFRVVGHVTSKPSGGSPWRSG
jgi:hypothetical protein